MGEAEPRAGTWLRKFPGGWRRSALRFWACAPRRSLTASGRCAILPVMRTDRTTTVVVVGGGHNGLAMSKRLADRGIDHVILERGEVADSWRSQRWDSFTLLTPNWQTCLPGREYDGDDRHGFMTGGELIDFLECYAIDVEAPSNGVASALATLPLPEDFGAAGMM